MAHRCQRLTLSLPESNLESINVVCTFWVCGWNPSVWPFKWKLLSSTFMWWCFFLTIFQNEIQDFSLRVLNLALLEVKGLTPVSLAWSNQEYCYSPWMGCLCLSPQHFAPTICLYPFILLGGDRHCESKVSCPRTQHNYSGQCLNPNHSIWSPTTITSNLRCKNLSNNTLSLPKSLLNKFKPRACYLEFYGIWKAEHLCKFGDKVNCIIFLGEISSHLVEIVKMTVVESEGKKQQWLQPCFSLPSYNKFKIVGFENTETDQKKN